MVGYAILLASLVFVIFVEGPLQPFWIWNALPLGATAGLLALARRRNWSPIPPIAFGVGAVGITVYAHAAWLFDLGGTATGSSTSGFLFLFLPVMAFGGGLVLYLVAQLVVFLRRR